MAERVHAALIQQAAAAAAAAAAFAVLLFPSCWLRESVCATSGDATASQLNALC